MTAVARRTLHVARGSERSAEWPLAAGSRCVIGAAPAQCDVVLNDAGVARRHCELALDARSHVVVTALEAPLWVGQRKLPRGASMAMPDFLPLRCGQATLLVGPEGSDWSYSLLAAESAPGLGQRAGVVVQQVRSASPLAFAALLLGSTLLVAGSVWGAVNWLTAPTAVDDVARVQRWLIATAPRDAELQLVVDDTLQRPVVTGYVRTGRERDALAAALARQPQAPRAEFVAVEPMLAAVRSLAQQHGLVCAPEYRGAGRVDCGREIADSDAADRLRAASQQVAGLRELALEVAAPAAPAAAAQAPRRRYAVLMSNQRGTQLVGPGGERWREGDAFDGMTIRRILLDQVVFERERSEVVRDLAELK
jgi:Inner membrane component of T3SS, cytoplasmic domain